MINLFNINQELVNANYRLYSYWNEHLFLTLKWWVMLGLFVIPWVLLYFVIRNIKTSTIQILLYVYQLKWSRKLEPLDSEIPTERPMKVQSIFQLLFEKGIYSVSGLLDDLKVDIPFLSLITGIEEAFFEKYQVAEQRTFSISDIGIVK
jgi:hypothetical protein